MYACFLSSRPRLQATSRVGSLISLTLTWAKMADMESSLPKTVKESTQFLDCASQFAKGGDRLSAVEGAKLVPITEIFGYKVKLNLADPDLCNNRPTNSKVCSAYCRICSEHAQSIRLELKGSTLIQFDNVVSGTDFITKHSITRHLVSRAHSCAVVLSQSQTERQTAAGLGPSDGSRQQTRSQSQIFRLFDKETKGGFRYTKNVSKYLSF